MENPVDIGWIFGGWVVSPTKWPVASGMPNWEVPAFQCGVDEGVAAEGMYGLVNKCCWVSV
jgi:hypothetical protein